jgi:hypothetical protein
VIDVKVDDIFLDELRRKLAEVALCLYKAEHTIEDVMDLITLHEKGVWKHEQDRDAKGQGIRV